jgi:hypothetical protein
VSAYEEKMKKKLDPHYHQKVKKIEEAYGGGNLTFPNFVSHVFNEFELANNCSETNCPYVDLHWKPFIDCCGFCDVPFRAVAKLETLDEDVRLGWKMIT